MVAGVKRHGPAFDAATVQKAIDAAPDAPWRVLIASARFGGLRVPSEPLPLRWADVNGSPDTMIMRSPKTERHAGGALWMVPIFPELRALLLEAFELAEPGQDYFIHRCRTAALTLQTHPPETAGSRSGQICKKA